MTMLSHDSDAARDRILKAGLAAFDRRVIRRRRTRTALAGLGGTAAIVLVATMALGPGSRTTAPAPTPTAPTIARVSLPAYVQILDEDEQLVAELELANACERIGRSAGRLFVIECVDGDSSG